MSLVRRGHLPVTLGALIAAVVAAVLLGPAPSAHALDGRLEFSQDGTTWVSTSPEALFDGDVVLVPGSSATATLHVRSTAETPGVLATALTNVRTSDEAAEEYFGVQASTDAGTGADGTGVGLERTRVADLGEHTLVGPVLTLEPGQSAQFTLTIDLDLRPDGTGAQNSAIGLDLAISFTDVAGAGDGGGGHDDGLDGALDGGKAGMPGGESPGGEHGEVLNPPQIIPAFPAGAEPPLPGASSAPPTAVDPGAPARGFLAITGIARSAIITGIAVTLLGGLLLVASRRGSERP